MSPSRPPRDYAFLHALGLYHLGEALDHTRSAEDSPRTQPSLQPSGPRLAALVGRRICGLFHRGRSHED
jgi:hypothetical protein